MAGSRGIRYRTARRRCYDPFLADEPNLLKDRSSMTDDSEPFNRGAIRPMECLSEAWQLVKSDYWFFLGVSLVGVLIGSMAQIILMGPMMCGIYLIFLNRMSARKADFNTLFKGFDFFLPSFIAMLLIAAVSIVLVLGSYLVICVGVFGIFAAFGPQPGGRPDPALPFTIMGFVAAVVVAIIFISILVHALFMFVFPLIVDRRLTGWEAVKLSSRAVWSNLGGVILLMLLNTALSMVGVLLCYVGAIFELPLSFALTIVAYRQVFPEQDHLREFDRLEGEDEPDEPAPAKEAPATSTEYQDKEPGRGA
jgi:hypothetical protein